MSQRLREFLAAYLAWIDEGALPAGHVFNRGYGLCYNVKLWAFAGRGLDSREYCPVQADENTRAYNETTLLREEMAAMFEYAGLDPDYPFCSLTEYDDRSYHHTHHLCGRRINWIRKVLEAV